MIFPFQIIINQYTKALTAFHILYNLPINLQSMWGGIRGLLDGKIWEWDLSFRREWDGNGNEVVKMGGNWYEKSVPAHL